MFTISRNYEISEEELVECGIGLGLFSDADLIEDARSRLRVMLNVLKDSCLLLDEGKECVKMHDMVRDVALWIASEGKNVFMSKHGMGPTAWSKEKGWEQYTAMSLLYNKIEELPVDLVCPKLEILLLGGTYHQKLKISDECFEGMKALKVLCLEDADLSLKSLQSLMNLKTLKLIDCTLRDITYLKKLNELEILYLRSSSLDALPRELSELRKLRWLSFVSPDKELERIPSNLIRGFSQLEELYISKINFSQWEIEAKCEEKSNASLFELNSLSRLVSLRLQIDATCLPRDFAFPKLQRHEIHVNNSRYGSSYKRILKISDIEATSFTAFKALYGTLEYLHLDKTIGCQNILPGIDRGGLNELKSLTLEDCNDLKFILDTSQQSVPADAFTNLVELWLDNLMLLREICYGGRLPKGFLGKLETIRVNSCSDICSLFPTELLLRLHKLKKVKISSCEKLQEVFLFQTNGLCCIGKENAIVLLPYLTKLKLKNLPQLRYIWNGPTHHVNLQSLKSLCIRSCERLEHIFPISIARGLVQLEKLIIGGSNSVKQVFFTGNGSEENAARWDGKDIMLPKLRELTLTSLPNLTSFLPESYHASFPVLEVLKIDNCCSLTTLISDVKMQDQEQTTCHKLRHVEILSCNKLQDVFPVSIARVLVQLEQLTISNCDQLKQIFFMDNGIHENIVERDGKNIILPKLREVKLYGLTSLASFFPKSYHASWTALEVLKIDKCSNLTTLISDQKQNTSSLFQTHLRLPNLKEVEISSCSQLQQIYQFQTEGLSYTEKENCHASFCPALEVLKIHGCFNLTNLISDVKRQNQKLGVLSLQNLTILDISECHKLQHLFSSTLARNMKQLKELKIERCDELEEIIFKDDEEDHLLPEELGVDVRNNKEIILLPQLKKLSIQALPKLASICPAGYHLESNLETLSIEGLSHDWLSGILNCFKDVKELCISYCGVTEIEFSAYDIVKVFNCPKLRRIVVPLPTLLRLSELYILMCAKLEEIIIIDDNDDEVVIHKDRTDEDDDVTSHHKQLEIVVELPKLEWLRLEELGSLVKFCPVNYHFIFPSLKVLEVERCEKMETRFSYSRGENGRVHVHAAEAATKAPKQRISCDGSEAFQRKLPPYIEKDNLIFSMGSAS